MAIEYLSFSNNKIDLSTVDKKREKPKSEEIYLTALKKELTAQAAEVNQDFPDFLNNDGQIKMLGKDAMSDSALVEVQEEAFSLEARKTKEDWLKDKELLPASLTEMSVTVLLHKYLKDEFIVARASSYDDYNNGVDQVLIDKKSGAIICGFDEVITHFKDGSAPKKKEKLHRKMLSGGARIKYGAVINNQGQFERAARSHLPAFYLALTKNDLNELLDALILSDQDLGKNEVLANIFSNLSVSLDEQLLKLNKENNLDYRLKGNLNKFSDSLEKIKKIVKNK